MIITIETKYNLGDFVFYTANSRVHETEITGIQAHSYRSRRDSFTSRIDGGSHTYITKDGRSHTETQLFKSREELIASL